MQRIKYGDEAAPRFRRLYDLIENNYSYLIFQNLKEMKATLSTRLEAKLDIPELDIELLVSREEFDVQTKVLARTRAKVDALYEEINALQALKKDD